MSDSDTFEADEVLEADEQDAGERLDKFIASQLPDLSRTEVQKLIKAELVQVNAQPSKASYRLEEGDIILIALPEETPLEIVAEDIPLTVLYEDEAIAALDKPAGMVVHPAYGHRTGTLVNAALHRWPAMRTVGEEEVRAGVVHRLDKGTSGVIVMAKTHNAFEHLKAQFKARTVHKEYLALVEGTPQSSTGIIDAPIARDPKHRKRMAVVHEGREAQTRYTLLEDLGTHTLIRAEPRTGRTHQIRVHMQWLGHPVVGDRVYGYRKQRIKMKRLFLHAAQLSIDSPLSGERLTIEAALPIALTDVLNKLRQNLG
jgi:23S rRNA pseudouridine1911/1915/1917 synthase